MSTSRTGTSTYLRNRKRVLAQARADGLTHCPGAAGYPCGRELDYVTPLLPQSAETDHVVPPKFGGTDDVENLTVLCRDCNVRKGDGTRKRAVFSGVEEFPMSRTW